MFLEHSSCMVPNRFDSPHSLVHRDVSCCELLHYIKLCCMMPMPSTYFVMHPFFRSQITALFEDQFYIPLIRCHDDSRPSSIGQPWIPNSPNMPSNIPVVSVVSPLDPVSVVSAVAGPMTSDEARSLCRKWRTPEKAQVKG